MSMDLMKKDLEEFNILLDEQQINQFNKYYELLKEWNSFMNLTTIIEFDEVLKKHFVDSLSLVKVLPDLLQKDYSLIDIGTGAGFPGIPLKIVFSNLKITLLDSLNKRVRFLNEVIDQLGLENITVIHGRAEDFAKPDKLRESFEICVSRAVANLTILSEYCIPFVKKGGYFISYKSEKITEEFDNAKNAIHLLGGKFEKQNEFLLPGSDIYRNLFVIKKVSVTPARFPRKAGVPSKEPLIK
ncbi:MAG: 16S rRNA (guanine(527)-N(7))-methyltransferase RsmG [Lachnospiraceae bacterium]|jgi:16S rRNA (guanine527-N7)-methyltransferase|nr:16S rRNA (guanine(527)-N(7))-methyltransferase RsmG [Lachnospiraceae bacterium]